ncbi:hypothetical protein [Brevundimonas vesicularis]|uniref:hypothetical protein n=1 Tax=Brevundimonas vesicularis TaxID=41276 RepID=UPI0038D374E4
MTPTQADNWSLAHSLAFLAASFAIVFGTLLPFGAYAASPGQPIIICSAQGPQTIHAGGFDGPVKQEVGAKCAACIMPLLASLPEPTPPVPAPAIRPTQDVIHATFVVSAPAPAHGPPRPPSTAPPHA